MTDSPQPSSQRSANPPQSASEEPPRENPAAASDRSATPLSTELGESFDRKPPANDVAPLGQPAGWSTPQISLYHTGPLPPSVRQPSMYLSGGTPRSAYDTGSASAQQAGPLQRGSPWVGAGDSLYSHSMASNEASLAPQTSQQSSSRSGQSLMPEEWPPGRPLRVAHLNAAWLPAGIENWWVSMIRYADPRRLQFVRCSVLTDWANPHQIRRTPVPVTVGGGRASVISAAENCDVMIVSDPGGQPTEVADWIGQAKPPLTLYVLHGDGDYTADRQRPFHRVADHFVSVSEHVRHFFSNEITSTRIRNGVDPARLVRTRRREDNRRRLGFHPTDFVVGFVGRFSPEKNPLSVVQALTKLPAHCKALLVGFGHLRHELLEYCARYLPGRFAMVDGSLLDNFGDHYDAMDVFVMPSSQEGYGLVAMEAMMCSVPVITTRFGLGKDLITDRVNGMIVEPAAESIAEAVALLDQHRPWAEWIGQFGKQTALRDGFASTMTEQYENLLAQLWQTARRR